ncbi:MAG TPA: carboxypeptidase regulatory-like domain-containing protein, partial [Pyrinomonadaceae bacterium]|nr:carboxypeptidase regulatory-like domain-containing protein [Pyrinomonadaceae bacterium]
TRVFADGRLDTREFTEAEVLAKRRQMARIRDGEEAAPLTKERNANWRVAEQIASNGKFINGTRISTQPSDDLIVSGGEIDVITRNKSAVRSVTTLSPAGETIAIKPMRLSVMGVPGMVVLQRGKIEPTIIMVAPQASYAVDRSDDTAAATACTGAANDCSLRGAVIASNALAGADIITFNAGINPQLTISSAGAAENAAATGDLDVNGSLTITGNAPTTLSTTYNSTCGDCKLFGMDQTGLFPGISVSISGMTMSGGFNNGAAFCGAFFETGGGIDFFLQSTGNVFSLTGSTMSGNTVTGCSQSYGGAIDIDSVNAGTAGGASAGSVTLTNNTIQNNTAARESGGINMFSDKHDVTVTTTSVNSNTSSAGTGGGGIRIRHTWGGTVTMNGGSVSSNTGQNGGGILIDGNQVANIGTTTGVTIQTNNAVGAGSFGGGVAITNLGAAGVAGSTQLSNSTIQGNLANNATGKGGGVYFLPAYSATISNCTITTNSSPSGAGVFNGGAGGGSTLTINSNSSILGNNATGAGGGIRNDAATSVTNLNGISVDSNTSGSGGDGIDLNAGSMNLSSNISVAGGDSINLTGGTFTSTSNTLSLSGSLTRAAAATFLHNSGTVAFNGNGAQNIDGTATSNSFHAFTVNKGGGTLQAAGSVTTLSIANSLTLTAGTFAAGTATAINMNGSIWTHNGGTFTPGSSVVSFTSGSGQTIGGSAATTFNGLTVNNTATSVNQSPTVNGTLTMSGGEITVVSPNILTIGSTGSITRTAGHVNGRLSKVFAGAASFLYHIGTPSVYSPATANVTAGSGQLTMRANTGLAPSTPPLPALTTLGRHWDLAETGALTASLTFNYLDSEVSPGTETNYRLIRSYGAGIQPLSFANVGACPGAGTTCVNTTANTIFQSGVVEFNGFWTAGAPTTPTAAGASISGRVTSADGRAIGRAVVIVSDGAGNTRSVLSSSFGYYTFDELAVGQTYTVTVQSKRYTFTPRTISLSDDIVGFDIIAEP